MSVVFQRQQAVKSFLYSLSKWENKLGDNDILLDDFLRKIHSQPPRPDYRKPYEGLGFSNNLNPIFPNFEIPEYQLRSYNYAYFNSPIIGNITVTGGFMEAEGHGYKTSKLAIFKDGKLTYLPSAYRNLGIDYCCPDIITWYSGVISNFTNNKGYGLRCYVKWDVSYFYEGKYYPVFGAFAHAKSFCVVEGERVKQGQKIGLQGSSGGNYAPHIDYRQWIVVDDKTIDLSPNALERQLHYA